MRKIICAFVFALVFYGVSYGSNALSAMDKKYDVLERQQSSHFKSDLSNYMCTARISYMNRVVSVGVGYGSTPAEACSVAYRRAVENMK